MKFSVREIGNDEWEDVTELTAEFAAEKFVAEVEPYSEGQASFDVDVKDSLGVVTGWIVEVEYSPGFYARPRARGVLK